MKTMKASEFKAICLRVMDEVAATGEGVIVTKNGKPVSRLEPYRRPPQTLFGCSRGAIDVVGDIVAPIEVEWEAAR